MILRTTASLALVTLLAACTAETSTPTTPTGQPPSGSTTPTEPGETTGSTTASDGTPVFKFSCNGSIEKLTVDLDLRPKCIGGPPGTNCGGPSEGCAKQEVEFHYEAPMTKCVGTEVYEWTGNECVPHPTNAEGGTLRCTGKDCEHVYTAKDACEFHQSQCLTN